MINYKTLFFVMNNTPFGRGYIIVTIYYPPANAMRYMKMYPPFE